MTDLFSLKGKVAIITGGSRGIGKGISRALSAAGSDIVIAARDQVKMEQAARELKEEFGVQVFCVHVDVQQESQIKAMVQKVRDTFKRIDILVNNAGMNIRKMPQDYLAAEWDEILEVNLRSAFLCSKAVYPAMKEAGGGKIISIGSMASIFGGTRLAPYGASKGGIVQLSRSLAVAWAPDNIQVNTILPGYINTDLVQRAIKSFSGLHEHVIGRTPVGRLGEPSDLAGAAIFLASSASDFITGIALPVDGGFSIII